MQEDSKGAGLMGEGNVVAGIDQLLPHLSRENWAPVEFSEHEWERLELTLEKPLAEPLRQSTGEAISYFIHTLRLKEKIPTPRQYSGRLRSRIAEIIDTADNLLSQVTPLSGAPAEVESLSPKAAKKLLGGRDATWNDAARASQTTQEGDEVWAVEDHVRYLVANNCPGFPATHDALLDLLRTLHRLKADIASVPHNKAGPDGDYELNLLLVELMRTAQAAGDGDLKLARHDIRDEWMHSTTKTNPAYRFVEEIVRIILTSANLLVSELRLPDEDRLRLLANIRANLDGRPGTLIDKLDAARAIVKGESQS